MGLASIFGGVVAIAKAVPQIKSILNQFNNYWIDYQISEIEPSRISNTEARRVIFKQIKGVENEVDRKSLSVVLANFSRELSNN